MERIKKILKPTAKDKHLASIEKFRKKHIPERYNQIKLMEYLTDDELDHYVSISNRADGKSFNYVHFLINYSLNYNVGFMFVVRHYTVRVAGQKLIQKIIDTFDYFNPRDFMFMRTDFYIVVIYRDRHIGIITDLNQATDLKYQSNYLQDFPIIVYDEFLAIEGDYLSDEWERLKTIYGSVNRKDEIDLIKIPKIIYLGNAVNFSSPILSNLNMFNILENHQMNTVKKYDNVILEFNRNDNANEQRNLRAFKEDEDKLTQGEFDINNHNIATQHDRNRINLRPNFFYVKLRNSYLKVTYNIDTLESILSIISHSDSYQFNLLLKDNIESSTYLDENYYDIDHARKYVKDLFLFDNMYSKDTIIGTSNELVDLRINKLIKEHITDNDLDNFEMKEKVYKENYIENTKKSLFKKFFT